MCLLRSLGIPSIFLSAMALAAESPLAGKPVPEPAASSAVEQQLRLNPDSLDVWHQYMGTSFQRLGMLVDSNPDEAQKRLDSMRQFMNSLQPTQNEAQAMLARYKRTLRFWEQRIQLARTLRSALEAKLMAKPNDGGTIWQYAQKVRNEVLPLIYSAPHRAEQKLKTVQAFLDDLRTRITEEPAKKAWEQADRDLSWLQRSIDMAREAAKFAHMPRAELEAKLKANPDDGPSIARYGQKVFMEVWPLVPGDAARAEQSLHSAKTFLDALRAKVQDPTAKDSLEGAYRTLARLENSIDRAKQRAALIGKDAAPLEVEAWVNGTPLTSADLKGNVVLLDFWAVWFGPSITALPRLREWHKKYADKGLVIVGLTRCFNYTWDEKTGRPKRAREEQKVPAEEEREMLAKFAERHRLPYRFAIQKGDTLGDYYVVDRLPCVVLIDREGKIRLIREGGGEKNSRDVQEMLERLLAGGG